MLQRAATAVSSPDKTFADYLLTGVICRAFIFPWGEQYKEVYQSPAKKPSQIKNKSLLFQAKGSKLQLVLCQMLNYYDDLNAPWQGSCKQDYPQREYCTEG